MRYIVKKGPKVPVRGSGGGQKIETWVVWDTFEDRSVSAESAMYAVVEVACKRWNDYYINEGTKLGKVLK